MPRNEHLKEKGVFFILAGKPVWLDEGSEDRPQAFRRLRAQNPQKGNRGRGKTFGGKDQRLGPGLQRRHLRQLPTWLGHQRRHRRFADPQKGIV